MLAILMRKGCTGVIASLLAVSLSTGNSPTLACAGWSFDSFYWTSHPSDETGDFLKGRFGILLPSFDTYYQVIAYRYLSKNLLNEAEVEEAKNMIEDHQKREDTGCVDADQSQWVTARKSAVGGTDQDATVETSAITAGEAPTAVCNIQTNAFVTAAKTLRSLVTKYGVKSAAVAEWVTAQDQVFANNDPAKPSIPKPLAVGDKLLQQHRAYQIAAAHFYAMQWADAIRDFTAIGEDASSPWCTLGKYLAVRSLIRKATLTVVPFDTEMMSEAAQRLEGLINDRSMTELHEDLLDLQDFVATKLDENSCHFAKQREHHLSDAVMHNLTARALMEYANTYDRLTGRNTMEGDKPKISVSAPDYTDLTDWINTFALNANRNRAHALSKWKATKNIAWLVAVLNKSKPGDTECDALLLDAAKVPASDRAFATLSYESARILTARKDFDPARRLVDSALALKGLDQSSHNLFIELRLRLARNIDEFARDSMAKSVGTGGDYEEPYDDAKPARASLMDLARDIYDSKIPLSLLRAAIVSKNYPAGERAELGEMTFVRAVVLKNEATAKFAAEVLSKMKIANASLYKSYTVAATADERKFIAAYIMLKADGSTPTFGRAYGYWWGAKDSAKTNVLNEDAFAGWNSPPFLTAADRSSSAGEQAALAKVPSAPAYLPAIVVAWAKSHPRDSRVPEALHYAVSSTKYGERDAVSGKLSKEAFNLLHKQHAGDHWTEETPYWYAPEY
jgi:hypothetical protein